MSDPMSAQSTQGAKPLHHLGDKSSGNLNALEAKTARVAKQVTFGEEPPRADHPLTRARNERQAEKRNYKSHTDPAEVSEMVQRRAQQRGLVTEYRIKCAESIRDAMLGNLGSLILFPLEEQMKTGFADRYQKAVLQDPSTRREPVDTLENRAKLEELCTEIAGLCHSAWNAAADPQERDAALDEAAELILSLYAPGPGQRRRSVEHFEEALRLFLLDLKI